MAAIQHALEWPELGTLCQNSLTFTQTWSLPPLRKPYLPNTRAQRIARHTQQSGRARDAPVGQDMSMLVRTTKCLRLAPPATA